MDDSKPCPGCGRPAAELVCEKCVGRVPHAVWVEWCDAAADHALGEATDRELREAERRVVESVKGVA